MSPRRGSTPRLTGWLTVSRNVTLTLTGLLYKQLSFHARLTHRPDDGVSTHLWNVGRHLIKNTAVHPRRLWASASRLYARTIVYVYLTTPAWSALYLTVINCRNLAICRKRRMVSLHGIIRPLCIAWNLFSILCVFHEFVICNYCLISRAVGYVYVTWNIRH
jgi:hypothetical protein